MRRTFLLTTILLAAGSLPSSAQDVARGRSTFTTFCAPCHGADGRGGAEGATDLTRSTFVNANDAGKDLTAFLKTGRPERRMPPFTLGDAEVADLFAFLRTIAAGRGGGRNMTINAVVVGDAKAGEAYFNGAGRCSRCHSPTGDLKGIGSRLTPAVIQGRIVLPRGGGTYPPSFNLPPDPKEPQRKVTVTQPSGEQMLGTLMWLTDFSVTLTDSAGTLHTFARNGDVPRVKVVDPLQYHLDHMRRLTDKDMHDLTAYLVTLK
ncbi:MAG TPA: c-type cytochrome [Vicinamibacterales bacterium]